MIIISIIIIYNISDLILLGKKDNSYFYFINLHGLSTIKKYKNHFPFQSHYIVCKTKYMCIIFISYYRIKIYRERKKITYDFLHKKIFI